MSRRKEKKRFEVLTEEEIRTAFSHQRENEIWNFYDEREFIENLLSQRFNYLLLVYSLFVTAFAAISGRTNKLIILGVGIIISLLISLTIIRGFIKLDISLKILHSLWDDHVFPIVQKETNKKRLKLFNVNPLIGWIIPLFCIISILVAFILIYFNIWIIEESSIPPDINIVF